MTLCHSETRRKQRRTNGLQMPWHPQQVAGWLVLAAFGACSFGILLPGLGPDVYPIVLFVLGSLFFLHVVSHVAALLIDPADPQLRALAASRDSNGPPATVPELDRSKHAHVIENGKCHLCNIYTSGHRTKHCGSCNKCVEKFDHHCKWLNHCIGARNYVAFVVSVVSAVLACLVIVIVSSAELVLCNAADPARVERYLRPVFFSSNETAASTSAAVQAGQLQQQQQQHQLFSVGRLPVDRTVFVAIASAQCALALIALVLLLHLCVFHVYISALGITTYEYIRNYRRYPEFDSRNGAAATTAAAVASSSASNNNNPSDGSKNKLSVLTKLYATACCYGAVSTADGRRKRPSCGIHSNLNVEQQQRNGNDTMTVETVESYERGGVVGGGALLLNDLQDMRPEDRVQQQQQPTKCRYCLEKNRIRGSGARFFVLGKRRKGFCCCCFQKPEPVSFGRTVVATTHHNVIKVPPSPFAVRRNHRVIPCTDDDARRRMSLVNDWKSFDSSTLPALSGPAGHRPMQKITLKELGQVLAFVEQQPPRKKRRAGTVGGGGAQIKHSKSSSNLSPIHESGLSNPSTPQLKNRCPQTRPCSWLSSTSPPHSTSKSA